MCARPGWGWPRRGGGLATRRVRPRRWPRRCGDTCPIRHSPRWPMRSRGTPARRAGAGWRATASGGAPGVGPTGPSPGPRRRKASGDINVVTARWPPLCWAVRSTWPRSPRRLAASAASDGGLTGWAWHPGDPAVDPVLTIRPVQGPRADQHHRVRRRCADRQQRRAARPRGFAVPRCAAGMRGLLHVMGRDGRDLLGSPLDPRAETTPGLPPRQRSRGCTRPHLGRRPAPPSGGNAGGARHPADVGAIPAGARRSMSWCRCMAGPSTRWPASTACWPTCPRRAG